MILRHATSRAAWGRIEHEGLDPAHARGRIGAIWLHRPQDTIAAIEHAEKRLGLPASELVVLAVDVPEDWVYTHVSHGAKTYYTGRHVSPSRIVYLGPALDWEEGGPRRDHFADVMLGEGEAPKKPTRKRGAARKKSA